MKILGIIISTLLFVAFFDNASARNFSDRGDNTVSDTENNLTWEKTEGGMMRWKEALTYCEELSLGGSTDWRLPSKRELISLVDFTKFSPALDKSFFPDVHSDLYWSSTTISEGPASAWGVGFNEGAVSQHGKTNIHNVRCVRTGQ